MVISCTNSNFDENSYRRTEEELSPFPVQIFLGFLCGFLQLLLEPVFSISILRYDEAGNIIAG